MKSPAELATRLAKQWQLADNREARLLSGDLWPLTLTIGKPTPGELTQKTEQVRAHVQRWRGVSVGEVLYERMSFRGGAEPVEVPVAWRLRSAREWVAAAGDLGVQQEYEQVERLLRSVEPVFRHVVVRQRAVFTEASEEDVIRAAQVALELTPGCARGRPLRSLAVGGVDSKFFERHRGLMVQLLEARFEGEVSDLGLEGFLGAAAEGDHWLLVAPLEAGLLQFEQQRVRASELRSAGLPGSHLLVVENEKCLHQLPRLASTVAVLGAGLHLEWLGARWVGEKRVGYWGDLDTWGLLMLGKARVLQPGVTALLMAREVFDACGEMAVVEKALAGEDVPEGLTREEGEFYRHLRGLERGRVEQEFVGRERVVVAVEGWRGR